jgi:hypothetical protein
MKKRYGLMSYISTGTVRIPTRKEMEEAFSQPWSKPNTEIILCGIETAEKLNEVLNGTGTTQNTLNPGKVY